jgi:hypothetical protein
VNLSTTAPSVSAGGYADLHLRTWSGNTNTPAKIQVVDYYMDFYSTYTDGYRFRNYNTDASVRDLMVISSGALGTAGFVGIGTSSPSQRLSVDGGNISLNYGNASANYYLLLNKKTGQDGGILFQRDNANDWQFTNTSTGNLLFYSYGTSTEAITFQKSSGNVGIGTTSPAGRLHIAGGLLYINTGQGSPSSAAYTSWNQITFNDEYSDVARGPNKIVTYGRGGNWVAGIGIHDNTQAYYAGGTHKWYRYDGTTVTLNLSLDNSGNLVATGDVTAYSDARVKDNVETIKDALQTIISLRGVTYTRNDSEDKSRKVGVIAQEVLPILPEVVQQDIEGKYNVAYGNIVGVLIEAIKEQQQQIDELKHLLSQK